MIMNLFPDQQETIADLRQSMRRNKSVLLQCPTGWGKTYAASYMIQAALNNKKRMIFTVPRKMLLNQTSQDFNAHGIAHSFIASGREFNPYYKVYIGMTSTMARRLESLPAADVVFFDECHYGDSDLDTTINHYKSSGAWVIGLSGTPWRLDGKGLGCWFDSMVQGASIAQLIEMGRLSNYRLYAPVSDDLGGKIVGDDVALWRKHAEGLRTIGFYPSVKKAEEAAEKFTRAGIPSASIDGRMDDAKRRELVIKFARREILHLTNCQLLSFGFDLKMASGMDVTVEAMIDQSPTESLSNQGQKNGRVLRYKKTPAIIIDQVGNYMRHGLPCDDREWTLEDMFMTEKQSRKQKGPRVLQCGNCFYCFSPAEKCPECGKPVEIKGRDVENIDGELREIRKEEIQRQKKKARMEVGQAKTIADLKRIAAERGYKNGWVYQQMKIKNIKS